MRVAGLPFQPSLAELGVPLHAVTFCVVDLETTGGSPQGSRITEVGAVKVCGGEVIGEFQTLVDPGVPIPHTISALTGITDGLVSGHPPIEAVLPAFLEFARGAALVAHNARFDTTFLGAALARLDYPRLEHPVVCTAALARRLVRDEVRDCKLATLARRFRTRTVPTHRALADARATVEVLHALLERAGRFGVVTLDDLLAFARVRNAPLFASRRTLSEGLPSAPGVYSFCSASGEILYVGKATDLRARVRSYFGNDDRRQIVDLLKESAAVEHTVCPTPLEAAVRELRLIRAHRPRFNRRSKHPSPEVYLKLTAELYPKLSIVRRRRDDGATYLGPLASRRTAERVAAALEDTTVIRRCSDRMGPNTWFAACALAEMGRCPAPCEQRVDPDRYAALVAPALWCLEGDPAVVLERLAVRMAELATAGRFEEAAAVRDRTETLTSVLAGQRRRRWVVSAGDVVAARVRDGRWEVVRTRAGRLVATASGGPPREALVAAVRDAPDGEAPAASAGEIDLVARWLEQPGVVLLDVSGVAACPIRGGRVLAEHEARLRAARRSTGRAESELADKRLRRAS
jgi:DNA polymerase-3 subunit epsilon